jgi:hypothetical protein
MWISKGNKGNIIGNLKNKIISSFALLDLPKVIDYTEHWGICGNGIPQSDIKSYSKNRILLMQVM